MTFFLVLGVAGPIALAVALWRMFATREQEFPGFYNYRWQWLAAVCLSALLAITGTVGYGASWGDKIGCRNTAHNVGVNYRWSLSTGCLFEFNGRYIPKDRWIHITRGEF